ncbi:MFS transporter [Ponticaulis sp.]|uniref:MFS transporter n=1 Tax=Ponticaulis sp. TaxID=2020902 RepID=UPI0025EEDE31|nr:MFS transporter [Ponticaulis sp.]|tara:strand:+ start:41698 stop:43002 length:1305 start_codon:yes stop_codon:yes gene_type:complete
MSTPDWLKPAMQAIEIDDAGRACRDIPESACKEEGNNFLRHVVSLTLSKSSDGLIDPKLVLSWLLTHLGAPAYLIGALVPVREAGALLPQLLTAKKIRELPRRKWAWALGALVQGLSALVIALSALFLSGLQAGLAIVGSLAVLAVARSVCSVSYKDVLGKTVDKSHRGTATGLAGSLSAGAVIIFALILTFDLVERELLVLFAISLAGLFWMIAALNFTGLREEKGATEGGKNSLEAAASNITLLKEDRQLRLFIITRGLLTVTALAPPFMITAAGEGGTDGYGGLGFLVLASAIASLVSSAVWGYLADRSSRKVLMFSAVAGAIALIATSVAGALGYLGVPLLLPVLLFGLMIAYQGVRLGRSTHLVDMANEDTRAAYTALSNTIIGVVLLAGGVFGVIASFAGALSVLGIFALMCVGAGLMAVQLEEVQSD